MNPFKRKCVVYCCMNVVTQEKYVGSTTNFPRRRRHHISDLELKKARSKRFQNAFDKYGKDVFIFFPLEKFETADQDYRYAREQFWIDHYKPEYNSNPIAGPYFNENARSESSKQKSLEKRRGKKQPREEIENRRKSVLKYYSNPENRAKLAKTPEQRKHLSEINTGERNPNWGTKRSEEFKSMIGNLFSSVQYTFTSPSGEDVTFTNLMGNGEKLTGLKYWQLRRLYKGEKKEINGWTLKEKIYVGYKKER